MDHIAGYYNFVSYDRDSPLNQYMAQLLSRYLLKGKKIQPIRLI